MKLPQKTINNIYKISDWTIKSIIFLGLIVIFLKPADWFWWVFFIILLIAVVVNVIFGYLSADEQPTLHKEVIISSVRDEYNPFSEIVSDDRRHIIEQQFRDLPSHISKKDCINMSVVSYYLTALEEMGYISPSKSADKNNLRLWVENVSGRYAPEQNHFNSALPSSNRKKIDAAKNSLERLLS